MNRRFLWIFASLVFVSVAIVESFPGTPNSAPLSATYSRGVLHVNIPSAAPREGSGTLAIDVLDPEDGVLAHAERHVEASGTWHEDLVLSKPLVLDDLVWHRVRYRFTYSDAAEPAVEGIESVSQILRMPVIRVFGQQSYLAGGAAAVRVIVTDSKNEPIAGPSTVRITLDDRTVFTGRLNRRGTTDAQFPL